MLESFTKSLCTYYTKNNFDSFWAIYRQFNIWFKKMNEWFKMFENVIQSS